MTRNRHEALWLGVLVSPLPLNLSSSISLVWMYCTLDLDGPSPCLLWRIRTLSVDSDSARLSLVLDVRL